MTNVENLISSLPDAEAARRFLKQFAETQPEQSVKLLKTDALLSDVLTLVSYSPLLAATLLQHPEYIWWLNRHRMESATRSKEELLESLARFSLTNSQLVPNILLARFRRRELLRIFLHDIRRLSTTAEITEEISSLADAILENALRLARQEMDNRYGAPMELDEKGRQKPTAFCTVSLGKLGSKELNYSSDIDLLFIYSAEGTTSGSGTRGVVTNREYFVKLAELVVKLAGGHSGEGAAYRVDLRLRPHGRVGPLAMSLKDTTEYYLREARPWERQVLIRSRASAGDAVIYKKFFSNVEDAVFSVNEKVEEALENVRLSKQMIDSETKSGRGFDVKLGKGGIREIEFIAQALQLAHGGRDRWLRAPHTLISLRRLADRDHIREPELNDLFDAYEFLRHLEHILQMENGLQTHIVPSDKGKREIIAMRMRCADRSEFEAALSTHTTNVSRVFERIFPGPASSAAPIETKITNRADSTDHPFTYDKTRDSGASALCDIERSASRFAEPIRAANLDLGALDDLPESDQYLNELKNAVSEAKDFGGKLAALRKNWSRHLLRIAAADALCRIDIKTSKSAQTALAEASIEIALTIAETELSRRLSATVEDPPIAFLGLGKLGGGGIDYDSDLDLVVVYDDSSPAPIKTMTHAEFYSRLVETFITTISGITRDGSLYRVDLRLRPHGRNGPSAVSQGAFVEYIRNEAAIWELLAYLKIRAVGGDMAFTTEAEQSIREAIYNRAATLHVEELQTETRRMRFKLEKERSRGSVDIKFGPGGMLDIYFAIRFLQLRDQTADEGDDRSSDSMLAKLRQTGSLSSETYESLSGGYRFLSSLDHNLRLVVGRTTKMPIANHPALETIAGRMKKHSRKQLLEDLTMHRLEIRSAFDKILPP